jgi:hypothetical protein
MSATATKSVNRGYLKKMAAAGRLYVRCKYHYTDDYAYDAAVNYGSSDQFTQVYLEPEYNCPLDAEITAIYDAAKARGESAQITHVTVEPLMEKKRQAYRAWKEQQDKLSRGKASLTSHDFSSKAGMCHGDKQSGTLMIHSNLSYAYEVR